MNLRSRFTPIRSVLATAALVGFLPTVSFAQAVEEPIEPAVSTPPSEQPEPARLPIQAPVVEQPVSAEIADQAAPIAMPPEVEEERFKAHFGVSSEYVGTDNLDFRDYNPANPEAWVDIYDTDDRSDVFSTRVSASLEYEVLDDIEIGFSMSHAGLWGGDKVGGTNAFGGFLYVDQLFVDWEPIDNGTVEVDLVIGRQPFEIGGAARDFFFDDVIDGVVLKVDLNKGGTLRVLPIDVYSSALRPDDLNVGAAINSIGEPISTSAARYDGDTQTYRMGAVYENTELIKGLQLRGFGFYADIGGTGPYGTGSDRTFGGAHGNIPDNDYTWMAGTRIGYELANDSFKLLAYGEFAHSGGLDRKATNLGLYDVKTNGNAFGAAVVPEATLTPNFGLRGRIQFFMADGGQYTGDEGIQFNHGFVSFKGNQAGGLAADRIAGWHPSAYVSTGGIDESANDRERKAGTMVLHAGVGAELIKKLDVDFDFYYFADTSSSNLDQSRVVSAGTQLPFGYDEFDLRAQERFGKTLGMEIDGRLGFRPNELLSFWTQGALFLPGDFYKIEIDRRAGTALGSTDPVNFWAVSVGSSIYF